MILKLKQKIRQLCAFSCISLLRKVGKHISRYMGLAYSLESTDAPCRSECGSLGVLYAPKQDVRADSLSFAHIHGTSDHQFRGLTNWSQLTDGHTCNASFERLAQPELTANAVRSRARLPIQDVLDSRKPCSCKGDLYSCRCFGAAGDGQSLADTRSGGLQWTSYLLLWFLYGKLRNRLYSSQPTIANRNPFSQQDSKIFPRLCVLSACLILSAAMAAQTTTITGTFKMLDNVTTITSGQVVFTPVPAQSTAISGTARFDASPITCLMTASGLKAIDGTSACTLLTTTAGSPTQGYTACLMPGNVDEGACFEVAAIGTTLDLSTVVFTPSTAPNSTFVDTFTSQTITGNKTFSGTVGFTGTGNTSFAGPVSASSTFSLSENGACSGAAAGIDVLCADPVSHAIKIALNGGSFLQNVLAGAAVTTNTLAKFDANGNVINSSLSDNGTTVSTAEAVSTSSTSKASAFIDQSANPAASGVVRTGNNVCGLASRNAANSADVCAVQVNASNQVLINGVVPQATTGGTVGIYVWSCNAAVTASSTLFMNTFAAGTFTCADTSGNGILLAGSSGTVANLRVISSGAGVNASSGVFTLQKCPAGVSCADTTITCTVGTGKTCSDTTHSVAVAGGDAIRVKYTTQAAETLANLSVVVEKN